jgi:hypothetical protein
MIQENLLFIAVAVFVFMLIGLVLTVVELNYGAPKRQAEEETTSDYSKR